MLPDHKREFLGIETLEESEIRYLLQAAKSFTQAVDEAQNIPILQGLTVANAFFENSTRTRLSFELAARKLGAQVLTFTPSGSSLSKGESLYDTAKTLEAMKPHAIVVRHSSAGSPHFISKALSIPVINAGDGFHEHPSQALLDAFTMESHLGDLQGKRILIIGDIAHSRVARSNIYLLKKLGAAVAVSGPLTLLPPYTSALGVEWSAQPDDFLPTADAVIMLRIQHERHAGTQVPTLSEYAKFWGLNEARAKHLSPNAIILHPGPINRGVEIDPVVADGKNSLIINQVLNGILVRMAILSWVLRPKELDAWVENFRPAHRAHVKGGHA